MTHVPRGTMTDDRACHHSQQRVARRGLFSLLLFLFLVAVVRGWCVRGACVCDVSRVVAQSHFTRRHHLKLKLKLQLQRRKSV